MNDNYKVYMHIFPNGKKYIGITSQSLKDRFDGGYGYQTPIMRNAIRKYGKVGCLCVCDCGTQKIVRSSHLVSGAILSCGCLARENLIKRNKSKKQREIVSKSMIGNKRRSKNEKHNVEH